MIAPHQGSRSLSILPRRSEGAAKNGRRLCGYSYVSVIFVGRLSCVVEIVNLIVEGGAVPAQVKHLVSPFCMQGDRSVLLQLEHEVEKGCAFSLGLLAVKDISLDNVSSMYELSEAFSAISLRHSCILFVLEHFDKFIPWNGHLIERILPEIQLYFA